MYVYKDGKEPEIIDVSNKEDWFKKGWFDTPAKVKGVLDGFNVEPGDEMAVQLVGETIEGVKNYLNGYLNLDIMQKKDLLEFGGKHLGTEFNKRATKVFILGKIRGLINDNSTEDNRTGILESTN